MKGSVKKYSTLPVIIRYTPKLKPTLKGDTATIKMLIENGSKEIIRCAAQPLNSIVTYNKKVFFGELPIA